MNPMPKTIGLIGWLWRGNFGDDLMAVLHAVRLKALGYNVVAWQLGTDRTKQYDIATVDTIEALVECSDAIVYAGGGLFTNAHRLMEPLGDFGESMERLCQSIRLRGIPLLLSSVGGDGENTLLSTTQVKMIELASSVTLRNEEDVAWFTRRFNKPYQVFPDIVWRTPTDLAVATVAPSAVLRHNPGSRAEKMLLVTLAALANVAHRRLRLKRVRCETQPVGAHYSKDECYTSLNQMLTLLSETKLVVTHRLHMGIATLAFGGYAIALRPEEKTRLVFERLGMSRFVAEGSGALLKKFALISAIFFGKSLPQLSPSVRRELSAAADGHIQAINLHLQQTLTHSLAERKRHNRSLHVVARTRNHDVLQHSPLASMVANDLQDAHRTG